MKPIDILFIGNSYTNRNDLPFLISKLSASATAPKKVQTERVIANGMSLKTHWNRGVARDAIRKRNWTYVVLQEQSTAPFKKREQMHEYVTLFNSEIVKHGSQTVLYLTWARQNAPERQKDLNEAYISIAAKTGARVVPAGKAWAISLAEKPQLKLHEWDKSHPTFAGSYLAACVFYATLMGASPAGLDPCELKQDDALWLQNTAWRAAQN